MSTTGILVAHGTIITPHRIIEDGQVETVGDTIAYVGEAVRNAERDGVLTIDATGKYVLPGLIDIHTYGAGGHDTCTGDIEALRSLRHLFPKLGVTAFLPTLPACSAQDMERGIRSCARAMQELQSGAEILGLYSEGLCVASERKGAQVQTSTNCTTEQFVELTSRNRGVIRIVTLAPELARCHKLVRTCLSLGIQLSIGHSNASFEQAMQGFDEGIRLVTHLFNAMSHFDKEAPGVEGAALVDNRVFVEVIADGHHVHPGAVRLAAQAKPPDKVILVTDSMYVTGTEIRGPVEFAGQTVYVDSTVARLANGRPAASILTMDKAVRNTLEFTRLPLRRVVAMATANPARFLGLSQRIGCLEAGKRADITIVDSEFSVHATIARGELVYQV